MSTRVVSESHLSGDDYTWVPSTEEFEALQERLNSLSRSVSSVSSSVEAAERSVTSQDKKIREAETSLASAVERIESIKSGIRQELTDGEWKATLVETVKRASASFEKKIGEVNQTIAGQISDLVKHEVSARALVDELSHIKDAAVKTIELAGDEAKQVVNSSIAGIRTELDKKTMELQELDARLMSGVSRYDQLRTQSEEALSKMTDMRKSLDSTMEGIESLHERIRQRGAELVTKIDASSDGLGRLKKLDRRLTIQTILLITTIVMAIVCAFLR